MTEHHKRPQPKATDTEPAAVAEAVRVLIVALVAAGWVAIPDAVINGIASLVGLGLSVALTRWTRTRVTPVEPSRRGTA